MINKIINTNSITFARALLASSTLITLVFTDINDLFPVYNIQKMKENITGIMNINFFLWFDNIYIPYTFTIIILIISILGIKPRYISILHSWVAYSTFYSMLIVEGGDQINCILTLLLIPICILDKRKFAWQNIQVNKVNSQSFLYLNAKYSLLAIKIQMAVLYFNAGISKIFAPEWSNGTAVYYWFNDNLFGAPLWLRESIGILFKNDISVSLINWSVIFLEIFLFIGLFLKQKYKYLLLGLGLSFHFLIIIIHGLPTFFLAMSAGLILYLSRLDVSLNKNILNIKNLSKKIISNVKKYLSRI